MNINLENYDNPYTSIYDDIQYVEVPDSNGLSPYQDQIVTVRGVVTVPTGAMYLYDSYGDGSGVTFIISDQNGGPWSSILCYSLYYVW